MDADEHAAILGVAHAEVVRNDCGPDARRNHEFQQSTTRWHQPTGHFSRRSILSPALLLGYIRSAHQLHRPQNDFSNLTYLAIAALAASIFSFTASRLKLAPFCMGGNSMAVMASFSNCCSTNTKRQNAYLN